MFSGSNSFLGGGNSQRGGPPQYGQQQQFGQQQPYGAQQQQQPTGFGQQPFQQQYTGFPQGGLQPQATGYPPQQQQFQQQPQYSGFQQPQPTGLPPQPTGFQQPPPQQPPQPQFQFSQPTGFQPQQQNVSQPAPPPVQQPQPTGMTSNDMANSFRSSAPQAQQSAPAPKSGSRIPNIRLSFITAQDQAKFEQLFKSATGGEQALSGEKAKDLLLRSKLDGNSLAQIWTLSDTTKSGQLLFPEFALAMYLCNLSLTGKSMPSSLPEKIRNEVSSMVDIISFGVEDHVPAPTPSSNAPNFNEPPKIQQPQAQNPNNQQLLSALTAQPTGFQVPQATGFQQPQPTEFQQPQPTGLQQQQTGFQGGMLQATGYTGPRPPMPPMPTGFGQNQSQQYGLSPQQTGFGAPAPLNAQPTGRPGQWGLVNAPASGLPNLQALQQQMMPQPGRESGFSAQGLRGNATVPWAVTKDEKKIYDDMFKAWDGFGKGYITGNQAIEVFSQSGLDKADLERIWTLSDPHNKGRLNLDEFAVAMHLIYRRLNGYPVPNQLPPELIPPSTRNLDSSIGTMKNLLSQDAQTRRSTGAFLQPQKTGVSYLKSRSLHANGTPNAGRKDATVFKNNDDDVGYRSSARRRMGERGRDASPAMSDSSSVTADEMSIDQLKKTIREKQVLLDAMDFEDEGKADEEDALDRKDRKEAEELFRRIRTIQENIDSHPNSAFKTGDSDAERRTLQRQLRGLQDQLPELASHVRRCERAIADAQLELFRLKDAKAHPSSTLPIVGTGPGGVVTESDRLKARARAMMQQRSAALSGKKVETGDDGTGAAQRLEEENKRVTREREDNEKMVRDVEESVTEYSKGLESSLKEGAESVSDEHERRRWQDGLGVEDEVKDFILDLQRSSRAARVRNEDKAPVRPKAAEPVEDNSRTSTPVSRTDSPASSRAPASTPQTSGSSYSSYRTAEERAAFIKQQAEQRMAERLAALGLKAPSKGGETAAQRVERERKEREDRLKQAEAEDARREQERQARLQGESIAPPAPATSGKPKPPPPAPRKNRSESLQSQDESKRAEQEIKEQALKEQEVALAKETSAMEDEEARQERELKQQREEAEASLRALEEQVKAGKVKKAEEKKRREAAKKEASEKEARLAAQRADIEAAKERERQLRLQLENMGDDDSSDEDEGPAQITPTESTPAQSMELPRSTEPPNSPPSVPAAPPPPAPPMPTITSPPPAPPMPDSVTSPSAVTSPPSESKNPFFRSMGQASSAAGTPGATSPEAKKVDRNPFHNLTQQDLAKQQSLPDPTQPPARIRSPSKPADEDDWSVVESSDDEDDDDDKPTGGSAKQLASILFGTMGPPRPLSAMDSPATASGPNSPAPGKDRIASPPPAPPMPSSGAPPAPPPPPPMPGSAAPPPPPMPNSGALPPPPMPEGGVPPPPPPMPAAHAGAPDRGGLLQQIQLGKGLKKVQTKDRSQASTAGRVL